MIPSSCRKVVFTSENITGVDLQISLLKPPGPNEALIKVVAVGVNRADVKRLEAVRQGKPESEVAAPGLEISGVISAIGDEVSTLSVGDEVVALVGSGGYAEYCTLPESLILHKPQGISLIDAAGVVEVAATFWSSYRQRMNAQSGPRKVLIHGGASGLGLFGTQLCKARGDFIATTCGSQEKLQISQEVGADLSVNYKDQDFVRFFQNEGIAFDLVIDPIGGSYIGKDALILAPHGHISSLGSFSGEPAVIDLSEMALKQISLTVTSLGAADINEKKSLLGDLESEVWPLYESGQIAPNVTQMFAFSETADALDVLNKGDSWGKLLVVID